MRWTKYDDERLKDVCNQLGTDDWNSIAMYFPNRTATQCIQRWRKVKRIDFLVFFFNEVFPQRCILIENCKKKTLCNSFG